MFRQLEYEVQELQRQRQRQDRWKQQTIPSPHDYTSGVSSARRYLRC